MLNANQSGSKYLASAPLHLPASLNDFFFSSSLLARQTHSYTQRHTHIPPSRRRLGGWQRGRPVICQPPRPRGNAGERRHKNPISSGFEARWLKLGIAATERWNNWSKVWRNMTWTWCGGRLSAGESTDGGEREREAERDGETEKG